MKPSFHLKKSSSFISISGYYGAKCEFKLTHLSVNETCITNVCNNGVCSLKNGKGILVLKM